LPASASPARQRRIRGDPTSEDPTTTVEEPTIEEPDEERAPRKVWNRTHDELPELLPVSEDDVPRWMNEGPSGTRGRIFHNQLTTLEIRAMVDEEAGIDEETQALLLRRPRTRAECEPGGWNEQRPCPFVGCKHHTYLDVNQSNGTLRTSGPLEDLLSGKTRWSCVLDVPTGGLVLDEVGEVFGVSRQRIQQVEKDVLDNMRRSVGVTEIELRKENQHDDDWQS
jgi:hypothetical protein